MLKDCAGKSLNTVPLYLILFLIAGGPFRSASLRLAVRSRRLQILIVGTDRLIETPVNSSASDPEVRFTTNLSKY
jgi:hypothetical protein